ncbi:hypothetical protein [Streptomyces sp. SA15]|uniref:hypothetical protein n=1 Tax=Streptomyces sp. SA15 TaxID=934019 RepID=UPI0011814CD3|nr:hypothetical protein [Streptomyces sp. SA15]
MRRRVLSRTVLGLEAAMGVAAGGMGILLITGSQYKPATLFLAAFLSVAITTGRDIVRYRKANGASAPDASER